MDNPYQQDEELWNKKFSSISVIKNNYKIFLKIINKGDNEKNTFHVMHFVKKDVYNIYMSN